MPTPLTDAIQALTTYANETTGASDTTLSAAVGTLVAGYGGGGSDEMKKWVTLSDTTTTADGNLSVAVTDISVYEFRIIIVSVLTTSVSIYISPNQTNGTHFDAGYGRLIISPGTSTGNHKISIGRIEHGVLNMPVMYSWSNYTGQTGNLTGSLGETTKSLADNEMYTAISVATYQSVPSGTRVIIQGR